MLETVLSPVIARIFRYDPLKGLDKFRGDKNLYISGFARSGNSWISYLFAYCLNIPCYDIDGDGTSYTREREGLRKYLSGDNDHGKSQRFDRVLKTHAVPSILPLNNEDSLLYIVRDGRDVIISYYFHILKQWKLSPELKRRIIIQIYNSIFPQEVRLGMIAQILGYEWSRETCQAKNQGWPFVRYEDMKTDAFEIIKCIVNQLDPEVWNPDVTRRAIEIFSFDNMQKEARRFDSVSHSTRKGIVGDWYNHFSPSIHRSFIKMYGFALEHFDYVTDTKGYQKRMDLK